MSGTLYLVATPIGNLGDLSPRAAETVTPGRAVLCAAVLGAAFDVFTAAGCTGTCPLILRMVNASMAMPPSG